MRLRFLPLKSLLMQTAAHILALHWRYPHSCRPTQAVIPSSSSTYPPAARSLLVR